MSVYFPSALASCLETVGDEIPHIITRGEAAVLKS